MKFKFEHFPVLSTERLILRDTLLSDAEKILFLRSDKVVNKFISRPLTTGLPETITWINMVQNGFDDRSTINWSICLKEKNKMIGTICFWNFSEDRKTAEIGYGLDPAYFNQGLMSEALKSILKFGFQELELENMEAYTHFANEASIRLLLKHNFSQITHKKDEDDPNNRIFCLNVKEYGSL